MGLITDDMKRIVESTRLAFVATVNPDGTPNLSPKSSLAVLGEDRIGFADIASPNTVRNLGTNPAIEVNAIDIFMRRGYRFRGTATLEPPGSAVYEQDRRAVLGRERQVVPDPRGGQHRRRESPPRALAGLHLHRRRDRGRAPRGLLREVRGAAGGQIT